MAANNAFEADGAKSVVLVILVASAIPLFPPLRFRPAAQGERYV
jgi:hypothetical protein